MKIKIEYIPKYLVGGLLLDVEKLYSYYDNKEKLIEEIEEYKLSDIIIIEQVSYNIFGDES